MSSFKLNLAMIDGCPDTKTLAEAIEGYGLPEDDEFGVLHCSAGEQALYATIVRKANQNIQKLDPETSEVLTTAVEKVNVLPIGIFPQRGVLEVYEGSASGVDQIAAFLASGLALSTVVTMIEIDIPAVIERLRGETQKFQLRSIRVSDYAHDSYMCGPYTPKFLDSEHGMDFLKEYVEYVTSASVSFRGQHGRVTVSLAPKACFRYSLSNEEDKPLVQALLRKMI